MERITPEFEKEFRELCERHHVKAAFVTVDYDGDPASGVVQTNYYLGGHRLTCERVKVAVQLAAAAANEAFGNGPNVTKH